MGIVLTVTPRVGLEPVKAHIRVKVDPHKDNRWLIMGVSCDGLDPEVTERQLDGEKADGYFDFYRTLSGCDYYYVGAAVVKADGSMERATPVELRYKP